MPDALDMDADIEAEEGSMTSGVREPYRVASALDTCQAIAWMSEATRAVRTR